MISAKAFPPADDLSSLARILYATYYLAVKAYAFGGIHNPAMSIEEYARCLLASVQREVSGLH